MKKEETTNDKGEKNGIETEADIDDCVIKRTNKENLLHQFR